MIWGKASDLSQGGCFIEMAIPLHNGISFDIALWLGEAKLHLQGQVVSVQPGFGNGVRFLGLTSEHQAHLRQFLETLSPSEAAGKITYQRSGSFGESSAAPNRQWPRAGLDTGILVTVHP